MAVYCILKSNRRIEIVYKKLFTKYLLTEDMLKSITRREWIESIV